MKQIEIIVADDHPLIRSGIKKEIENNERFNVIGESGDGEEALKLIRTLNPGIAVLDFEMPGLNGLEILKKIKSEKSDTKIILLTMHRDKKIFYKALDNGVCGYILKDDAVNEICDAIEAVSNGGHFISASLSQILTSKVNDDSKVIEIRKLINDLTPTELIILKLISELKSNQQIADKLFISKRTVENHKVHISDKLLLKSARELFKFAIRNKECIESN